MQTMPHDTPGTVVFCTKKLGKIQMGSSNGCAK